MALVSGCGARSESSPSYGAGVPDPMDSSAIDSERIDAEHISHRIRVVGRAGAAPGGARVAIVNTTTQATIEVEASADGAFEAVIVGDSGEGVRVQVTTKSGTSNANIDEVDEPVFECLGDDLDEFVCDSLWREASCEWNAAVAAVNGCRQDSDCIDLDVESRCFQCSPLVFISKAGTPQFQSALQALENGTCAEIDFGCGFGNGDCFGGLPAAPGCRDGICGPLMGCEASVYSATRHIDRNRARLAEGCTADDECRVEWLAPCAWGCPVPIAVSADVLYDNFASVIDNHCAQTPDVEQCESVPCEAAAELSATCSAGACALQP